MITALRIPLFILFATLWVGIAQIVTPAWAEETDSPAPFTIMVLGDSLSAGYNLPPGVSIPDGLEDWLLAREMNVQVINAGVSGDTTTGGRSRMEWAMASAPGGRPDLMIIALGGNDMLRGVPPEVTRANIDAMLARLAELHIPAALAGMMASPTYGDEFASEFNSIYPDMAAKYDVPLYPLYIDGIVGDPDLNQSDGIHPNAEGVAVVVARFAPFVENIIKLRLGE